MNQNIQTVFDKAAHSYDSARRKYIPCFDDFYRIAIEQIPFRTNDTFRIIDLGAGTGLMAEFIKKTFQNADITLVDVSGQMLNQAEERFRGMSGITILSHNYITDPIPSDYDVIISALSLHHSTEKELASVFSKGFTALKRDGIFINADQILGSSPEIEKEYENSWLTYARKNGCTAMEIEIALERMKADKTLPLKKQLALLKGSGFTRVNCWYQFYRYAVYSGRKFS